MRARLMALVGVMALALVGASPAGASDEPGPKGLQAPVERPETIPLPNGFQPEGIVFGYGPVLYAGSLADGAIYAANALTGEGHLLVEGEEGRIAVGLEFDPRTGRLYVAGGATGMARVYDADTGTELAEVQLAEEPTFVNDVALTEDAAYFTDSARAVLHRVALDDPTDATEVPIGGEFVFEEDAFNANGIAAVGGSLVVAHSGRGELYSVDPATGHATLVDLGGQALPNADGLVVARHGSPEDGHGSEKGGPLYVVQNRVNQVSVVDLADDLASGTVTDVLTSELFRVPTTGDLFGGSLYVVNARFGTEPGPDVDYDVVRVPVAPAATGHGCSG
ncbi:MAG: superoxide dismutase [Acidimicrobiia bacterium]|nr:superoxide dismutase [Acidimicrobiia bacterium]